jgi:type I restriction enzyme M protein
MQADGFSLDDKRNPTPDNDDIPDVLLRWRKRSPNNPSLRTEKCFFVSSEEVRRNNYDLSINRYKEAVHQDVDFPPPKTIIANLRKLDSAITVDLEALERMLP